MHSGITGLAFFLTISHPFTATTCSYSTARIPTGKFQHSMFLLVVDILQVLLVQVLSRKIRNLFEKFISSSSKSLLFGNLTCLVDRPRPSRLRNFPKYCELFCWTCFHLEICIFRILHYAIKLFHYIIMYHFCQNV